jgi:hypothetical protein
VCVYAVHVCIRNYVRMYVHVIDVCTYMYVYCNAVHERL